MGRLEVRRSAKLKEGTSSDHEQACADSCDLCEHFGVRLQHFFPEAKRLEGTGPCAYFMEEEKKPFAWVYHTKKRGSIHIWLKREIALDFQTMGSTLPLRKREDPKYKGPFFQYGHHLIVKTASEIDELFYLMSVNKMLGSSEEGSEILARGPSYWTIPRASQKYIDGNATRELVTRYERDPAARKACVEHYGCVCQVCGIDFGAVYGREANGLIHVHHLLPLSEASGPLEVDPVEDLRPVCPNCHSVIHLRKPCYSIDEVKNMLNGNKDEH